MGKRNDAAEDAYAEDRKAAKKHPDYKLITACVQYAFAMGGANVAYRTDPTDATVPARSTTAIWIVRAA